MAMPQYQMMMLPLLRRIADGEIHVFREVSDGIADDFGLSLEERTEELPSGTSPLRNRVSWAATYLRQAGLLESPRQGQLLITAQGGALLAENPAKIDTTVLSRYDSFREYIAREKAREKEREKGNEGAGARAIGAASASDAVSDEQTPEEAMAAAYRKMRKQLEADLLERIKASPPALFEQMVVDLLLAMGYGGSRQDAGRAIGRSGDGGIDGIIKEDRLGLDAVFIQAKRWQGTVGRPEIQKFAGALQGQRASKGVFITTSSYTREAIEYAKVISTRIVLIDGEELTTYLVDHNIAVTPTGIYEIKKIDSDYFEGE